jgi:glycosyltransferase involved in cell wall biosynthesis
MKILYLNNYNYLRGGAENVFFNEKKIMQNNGQRVYEFTRNHSRNIKSDYERYFPKEMATENVRYGIQQLRSLPKLFYNFEAKLNLENLLRELPIDVAHAHNIYGGLTTAVLDVLRKFNIPVLITLHDYKLICPNYKLLANGKICEDCKVGRFYMAVRNCCHKESLVASTIYATETYFNEAFKKYKKNVKCFISPSVFLKNKFEEFGWEKDTIVHIPNFIESKKYIPNYAGEEYFVYVGRLSMEKGIGTLIRAFMLLPTGSTRLVIIGEGPMEGELKKTAKKDTRIEFRGYLYGEKLNQVRKNAAAVVVPSEWYENAPLTILEAFALGKPVIGARIGGIPEMIEDGINGFLFEAGNIEGLAAIMDKVLKLPKTRLKEVGKSAREKTEKEYSAERHYQALVKLYQRVLN